MQAPEGSWKFIQFMCHSEATQDKYYTPMVQEDKMEIFSKMLNYPRLPVKLLLTKRNNHVLYSGTCSSGIKRRGITKFMESCTNLCPTVKLHKHTMHQCSMKTA